MAIWFGGVVDQRSSLVQLIDGVESAMEYTLRDEMKIDPADIADFDEVCSTSHSRNCHSEHAKCSAVNYFCVLGSSFSLYCRQSK
jgi:hypothetical protein